MVVLTAVNQHPLTLTGTGDEAAREERHDQRRVARSEISGGHHMPSSFIQAPPATTQIVMSTTLMMNPTRNHSEVFT